jgi:transposase
MFIRRIPHKNKKTRKEYHTYKLVDSIRTERGPRQRVILNMGVDFKLPKEQWKDLANCIEGHITGQKALIDYPKEVKTLAGRYAKKIIRKQACVVAEEELTPDYATVDVNSIDNEEPRTVGSEYVIYETIKELKIDEKLSELGLNRPQLAATLGVIAGRMIVPGSERATHHWLQNVTALDELMGVDFSILSLDRVYKVSDRLLKHKDALEEHLRRTEGQLFVLEEKIILYDLTNTFFEGSGKYNPKARYGGNSKEKRSDCPLVTLGLVLDMDGFPKKSRIFEGNVSEPKTLETMIRCLSSGDRSKDLFIKPTIVLDAGIATEENIQWLKRERYPYIVVSRKKKKEIPSDVTMVAVKEDNKTKTIFVKAGFVENQETDELELYCHSIDKEKKEESIKTNFQQRFEAELIKARNALHSKNGTKRYDKVVERMGRLKERYKLVSHGYKVTIEKDSKNDKAKNIIWSLNKAEKTSGVYCLRTNRKDLNEQQIWDIYTMLTDIEDAFRCMKSELGMRPIYHQKEPRCDGHIFITLLAYHLLHTIRFKLRQRGVRFCWTTIRKQLSTQVRVTTTMKRKDGKVIYIRKSSKAEPSHQVIYNALNLPYQPGKKIKTIL